MPYWLPYPPQSHRDHFQSRSLRSPNCLCRRSSLRCCCVCSPRKSCESLSCSQLPEDPLPRILLQSQNYLLHRLLSRCRSHSSLRIPGLPLNLRQSHKEYPPCSHWWSRCSRRRSPLDERNLRSQHRSCSSPDSARQPRDVLPRPLVWCHWSCHPAPL